MAEDDALIGKAYEELLKANGYHVLRAKNGVQALEMIESKKPKLVLLDLRMPQKDGFQVLEEMNEKGWIKKISVVVTSNLDQEADVERCKALGAKDYVVKANCSIANLIEVIKKYI